MKILFFTNLIPYPLDNGGKIKTFTTIKSLHEEGHSIDVLCFRESLDLSKDYEEEMGKVCNSITSSFLPLTTAQFKRYMIKKAINSLFSKLPFSVYKYYSKEMIDKINSFRSYEYDIIYFDHLPLFLYYSDVKNIWPNAKVILDEHNCETIIVERKRNQADNIIKKLFLNLEYYKMKRFEATSIEKSNNTIVLSNIDYVNLKKLIGTNFNHSIIPIGVMDMGIHFNQNKSEILNILFLGTLSWEPNNLGLIWFLKEVVPILEEKELKYHLFIVGKNPSNEVKKISESYKNVTITGYVDSTDEYYNKCHCMIVPLFIGSGQRVKLIEAFSRGMPAISTTIGAEGLECKNNDSIVIADDCNSFVEAIMLMYDNELRKRISHSCRNVYEKYYSMEEIAKLINNSINNL